MKPASLRASGSTGKEKASRARSSEGPKKSDKPQTSYSNRSPDAMSGASDPAPSITTPFPRSRLTLRRKASHRLAELYRLAEFYRKNGIRKDPDTWAFVLAATLGVAESAWLPIGKGSGNLRWPGLTLDTLKEAIAKCDLGYFDDDELVTKIKSVELWQAEHGAKLISMKRLGEMLSLTAAERETCRIRTIDAVDETREERKDRLAEARRKADREDKRAKRGRMPREVYRALSLTARQPWTEAGVSRTTWYRALKKPRETSVSADHIDNLQRGETDLSQQPNRIVAGPASNDSETLTAGADAPSAHGLAEKTREGCSSNQKEHGTRQTQPHPALAHLPIRGCL